MANQRTKTKKPQPYQLLVEGTDDKHVVWHLCEQHSLPEVFVVETPGIDDELGGIDAVIDDIPIRIKEQTLRTLGIVVDSDLNSANQWARVRGALPDPIRVAVPETYSTPGWVGETAGLFGTPIRVGVWLMPAGTLENGMLEDFALGLIALNDPLLVKAHETLRSIETEQHQRYIANHRSKALIHTWLAWQRNPGCPMGTAIRAGYLRYDAPSALSFVAWLRRLFALDGAPEVA